VCSAHAGHTQAAKPNAAHLRDRIRNPKINALGLAAGRYQPN